MNSVSAFIPPAPGKGFFDNYKEILFNTRFLRFMANTLFYAAIMIVAGVIVNGLAGYALAKIKFPFRDRWLAIIMMLMIIPTETIITINFMFVSKMGLLNTVFGYVLPMSKTVVATVSVFTFLNVWNDYLWPSLVFTSSDLLTAQIGLNSITSNDNTTMGQTLAVITLITIPVIIIYALFSKQIVEGVVSTGSKEG